MVEDQQSYSEAGDCITGRMSAKSNSDVLILGATGLLGSALAPFLETRGHHVKVHGRHAHGEFSGDVTDWRELEALLNRAEPEVIVNLVALTDVDRCEAHPIEAYLANVRSVENIVRWMQQSRSACHLIQISTDQVYDGPGVQSENRVAPKNYYAFSKYAGELAAAGVSSTVLRTNFFGRSRCAQRQSLTDWLFRSLSDNNSIQVFDDILFSPLSMPSLLEAIELVIQRKPIGNFNLGAHSGMSKADFAFSFAEQMNLPTQLMQRTTTDRVSFLKTYRPKNMRMDCSKLENELEIRLPRLIDEIKRIVGEYHEDT